MGRCHGLCPGRKPRPLPRPPLLASDALSLAYSLHPWTYPPACSVPPTPAWRLASPDASPPDAACDALDGPVLAPKFDLDSRHNNHGNGINVGSSRRYCPSLDEEKAGCHDDGRGPEQRDAKPTDTVLYLAYGSNLAASCFLGARGMRPLSQVNVSCPVLDLAFDLPGIPYQEPCFSNAVLRKVPVTPNPPLKPPPGFVPAPPGPPGPVPNPPQGGDINGPPTAATAATTDPAWTKGLFGVVYELTRDDYAYILADEAVDTAYVEVLVPCYEVLGESLAVPEPAPPSDPGPPRRPVPGTPFPTPHLPQPPPPPRRRPPFLARTLCMPWQGLQADDGGRKGGDGHGDDNDDSVDNGKGSCGFPRHPLTRLPVRPHAHGYAQPSLRYLSLLRTGAAEHGLPADYRRYLDGLAHYEVTTWRQRVLGLGLFARFWCAVAETMRLLAHRLADDETGKVPGWITPVYLFLLNLLWWNYDTWARRLCGNGERTDEDRDGGEEEVV